jgi:deazaflavin-dependent oxidoreductase (nitroreductase family)
MPLPRALALFNRMVTNRIGRVLAPRVPGGGNIVHRGRRSGREYRTPISAFRRPGGYAAALTYGPGAEWVRNVLAAGNAVLETGGRSVPVTNPRVIRDSQYRLVPRLVGDILRLIDADAFLLLDEAPPTTPRPSAPATTMRR